MAADFFVFGPAGNQAKFSQATSHPGCLMALNYYGGHKPRIGFRRKAGRQVDTKRILDPLRLLNGGEIGAHLIE